MIIDKLSEKAKKNSDIINQIHEKNKKYEEIIKKLINEKNHPELL